MIRPSPLGLSPESPLQADRQSSRAAGSGAHAPVGGDRVREPARELALPALEGLVGGEVRPDGPAIGWFRRRRWGWGLAVTIIALNMVGDIVNVIRGEGLKGAVGVAIAGMLLVYLTRRGVRNYFRS